MRSQSPRQQVAVINPRFFCCALSLFWSLSRHRTTIYVNNTSFLQSGFGKLWLRITRAEPLTLEQCIEPDPNYFYGDKHQTAGRTVDWLIATFPFGRVAPVYENIQDVNKKLIAITRAYVDNECKILTHLAGYLSGHQGLSRLYLFGTLNEVQRRYLQETRLPFSCILPHSIPGAGTARKGFSLFAGKVLKPLVRKASPTSASPDSPDRLPGRVSASAGGEHEVLFFPHQTVSYGGLFFKDQFYSDQPDSPFFPSNILHVEYQSIDGIHKPESLIQYYREHELAWCYLPDVSNRRKVKLAISNMLPLALNLGISTWSVRKSRTVAMIQLKAYWQYLLYLDKLSGFARAKIALVGYEILFPKMLSLALESRNISTVASQERFHVSVFFENWNYFLNTYFCYSSRIAKWIGEDRSKSIKSFAPTGMVRSDLLHHYSERLVKQQIVSNFDSFQKLVVVFDTPVFRDRDVGRFMFIANWRCSLAFYEEIIQLASDFPHTLFIIRSKDIDWLTIPEFGEMVVRLESTTNIRISKAYERPDVQYMLAAVADLVICKYSSIGDECLAAGIPVIFHDYSAMQNSLARQVFDYLDVPVFAHDYVTLYKKTKQALRFGSHLNADERERIAIALNDRVADGRVRFRIQNALQALFQGAQPDT